MHTIRTPAIVSLQPVRCCGGTGHQTQAARDPRDPGYVDRLDPAPPAALRLSIPEVLERLTAEYGVERVTAAVQAWAKRNGVSLG